MARYFISFDGSNAGCTSGLVVPMTAFSFSLWIIQDTQTVNARIIDNQDSGPNNGFAVVQGSTLMQFKMNDGVGTQIASISFGAALQPGTLYHLVGTYDGSQLLSYTNGVQQQTASGVTATTPAATLTFGRRAGSSSNFLKGSISTLRFWNRGITAAEALLTYQGSRITSGLIAEYLFNDKAGTSAADTGGSNTGTLTGSATWRRLGSAPPTTIL